MKILITGATGGLGRNCVEMLCPFYEVLATGRNLEIGKEISKNGVKFVAADLSQKSELIHLNLSEVEVVIHCAALATPVGDWEDFYQANVVATENVARYAKKQGVKKIIHISTSSVYHSGESRQNIKESDMLPLGKTNYAVSKRLAEQKVLELADDAFQVVVLRPRALIGKYDQVILPRILEILNKKKFPMFNEGKALIDVTSIKNVVHAIDGAIKLPKEFNRQIYNITNNNPMTVKELVDLLSIKAKISYTAIKIPLAPVQFLTAALEFLYKIKILSKPSKFSRYSIDLLSLDQTLNIDKALDELKYLPQESISEAIVSFLDWKKNETI